MEFLAALAVPFLFWAALAALFLGLRPQAAPFTLRNLWAVMCRLVSPA